MTHKRDKNEILDVVNYKDGWLRDMIKDVTKRSTAQQVVIGGVSGWWVTDNTNSAGEKSLNIASVSIHCLQ